MLRNPVTDITVTYDVALVTVEKVPGSLKIVSDIFNSLALQNINLDMISQTPPYKGNISLSFSVLKSDLVKTISVLNRFKKKFNNLNIEVDADNTKISVYGQEMKNIPGVAARLYTLLSENEVEIKLVTTSEVDISYLVYEKDVDKALEAIKKDFDYNLAINPV